MGMDVVGTEMAQVAAETEVDKAILHEKENGKLDHDGPNKEPTKLDSVEEEAAKEEDNNAPDVSPLKNAVSEWPEAKRTYFFPFVRYSRYEDPKIKAKLQETAQELQKWTEVRRKLIDELRAIRSERAELISQRKVLHDDLDQFRSILGEKKREMDPVEQLRLNNAGGRVVLCSSEEELNDLIYSLQYRIQHESIPLAEEKKLIKEIRNLEATRDKVIENAAKRAEIQESMAPKDNQVKLTDVDLDGVKKDQQATWNQIKHIKEKRKPLDSKILSLEKEFLVADKNKKSAMERMDELRKQQDQNNIEFMKNLSLLWEARDLAARKDKISVEKLSQVEMEKFMSLWCSGKSFRDDYEKRLLPSLDRRQFGRDGRLRNPEEKPLVTPVARVPSGADMLAKPSVKEPKDNKSSLKEKKLSTQRDASLDTKDQKAISQDNAAVSKSATDNGMVVDDVLDKSDKKPNAHEEVDEAKLKEMKREEEIAKAKQAMERKKKLAEKAAAKAALKAQKEAEKKLKEREKRAKKKAAASGTGSNPGESTEPLTDSTEAQTDDVNAQAPIPPPVHVKDKVQKEKAIRQRRRAKGPDPLPRAILKRKKSNNNWVWAAAAALVFLMLSVFAYYYLF